MPEPDFPPTPAASTDLVAQQTGLQRSPGPHFILPPPAMNKSDTSNNSNINSNTNHDESALRASTSESSETSTSSYRPASPISPAPKPKTGSPRHKRTSSGAIKPIKEDDFNLPPPPSRSRKIIHVQPKSQPQHSTSEPPTSAKPSSTTITTPSTSRRKPPTPTSAAGRKMARRTAHSIIERRRRSKMNEEFDTLKNLIPACEGQEMHKLAILQAGVEYLRYLEDCVQDLKGRSGGDNVEISMRAPPALRRPSSSDSVPTSPAIAAAGSSNARSTLLTPAFNAIQFSPEISRQGHAHAHGHVNVHGKETPSPSPNILPRSAVRLDHELDPELEGDVQVDQDYHDATAALLMLNSDRRGLGGRDEDDDDGDGLDDGDEETPRRRRKRVGGMSVRDLLST